MSGYEGKRVYVTGGSSGIGKSIAAELVRQGAHVFISARGQDRLDAAVAELKSLAKGDQIVGSVAVDVSNRSDVEAAATTILSRLGGLDILINNAGIAVVGVPEDATADEYERAMAINFFGSVYTTMAFLPHFRQQGAGTIGYVSSALGRMGLYGYSAYAASKFAMTGYVDCLRQDLMSYGIQVSIMFPADTDTPQWHEENKSKPPATKALAGAANLIEPEYVARTFLAKLAKGRYRIAPGFNNAFILWANDKVNWLPRMVIDSELRKFFRKAPASKGTARAD